jgi:lipoprotein-anchoring transpeptidase ErfK/SrfK
MRTKSFIAVSALLLAMLAVAGGVYAYDSSREDLIAEGVKVGGVDVSGLTRAQARERLSARLLDPLAQPVTVRYHGKTYTLTSQEARVGVNIDRSVGQAVERSRSGGIIERTVRGLTGGRVNATVPVDISFDRRAVKRLATKIEDELERPAVDADVDLSGSGISTRPSRTGLQVRAARLRREIAERLVATNGPRTVRVHARTLKPKVTTEELADRYPAILIVNRSAFRLTLYKHLKPAKTYPIAVGQAGLETPAGRYSIQSKDSNPAWHVPQSDWAGDLAGKVIPPGDPKNPIKARWMGIYNGAGIHGTDAIGSLGTAASHGCIRMAIPDVEELFDEVPVAAPVYIA